jgi:transcriptional regulator with XRE-family HTH domain
VSAPVTDNLEWATLLKRLRLARGWTQAEMGLRLGGVAAEGVSRRETGVGEVTGSEINALAESMALTVEQLLRLPEVLHEPTDFRRALGGRLRRAREARGMSQGEVAEELKVSRALVSKWERGEKRPTPDNLARLEDLLGLSDRRTLGARHIPGLASVSIPVVNRISAGQVVDYENASGPDHAPHTYIDGAIGETGTLAALMFALEVVGDSMEPTLHEGDIVVLRRFDPSSDSRQGVPDGAIVYVRFRPVSGRDGGFLARWYVTGEQSLTLRKDNPRYMPIVVGADDIEQCAVVTERRTTRL